MSHFTSGRRGFSDVAYPEGDLDVVDNSVLITMLHRENELRLSDGYQSAYRSAVSSGIHGFAKVSEEIQRQVR